MYCLNIGFVKSAVDQPQQPQQPQHSQQPQQPHILLTDRLNTCPLIVKAAVDVLFEHRVCKI